MTLRESLIEHYCSPEQVTSVIVNGYETTAWDADVHDGDVVTVDWPYIGIRTWTIGKEIT